jgi:hypothetical protein
MDTTFTPEDWDRVLAICKTCPFYVWADSKCVICECPLDPRVVAHDPICPENKW